MLKYLPLLLLLTSPLSKAGDHCAHHVFDWQPKSHIDNRPLFLNGSGSRSKWLWDVYSAALYLPSPEQDPQQIIDSREPRRLLLHFHHAVPASKLRQGWREGFEANHSEAQMRSLRPRLEQAYALFRDMQPGDRIALDFLNDQKTRLIINEQPLAEIEGADFFAGILKIWLGDHPTQASLKQCLLGRAGDQQQIVNQTTR